MIYASTSPNTMFVCSSRYFLSFSRNSGREFPRIATASRAALIAPALPIASVPTGTPLRADGRRNVGALERPQIARVDHGCGVHRVCRAVPRQSCVRGKIIDVGIVGGQRDTPMATPTPPATRTLGRSQPPRRCHWLLRRTRATCCSSRLKSRADRQRFSGPSQGTFARRDRVRAAPRAPALSCAAARHS